ncbi:MAG: hypothetical protein MNPFHGCM_00343 [Gemmatimonadaceae bacterium]|nr:hypothetical protein [Gemmatimonadaceae bacterium]
MWALLKSLLAKWALFQVLLRALGSLAWLIPVAFILKAIGIPALLLLLFLGAPILIVLAIFGLPLILVLVAGGVLIAAIFAILAIGVAALKVAVPIVLLIWLANWLFRSRENPADDLPPTAPDAPPA